MINILSKEDVYNQWSDIVYMLPEPDQADNIYERALGGDCQVLTIELDDAIVAVCMLEILPDDILHFGSMGGTRLVDWFGEFLYFVKAVAEVMKCDKVIGISPRKAWGRYIKRYFDVSTEEIEYRGENMNAWVIGDKR